MKTSTTQIDELCEQAWTLRYHDPKEIQGLVKQISLLSEKNSYERGVAYYLLIQSVCNFLQSNDDHLLENLLKAFRFFESSGDKTNQSRSLNFIGNVYESYGEYENALKHCLQGLKIAEMIDLKEEESDISSTLGLIYLRLADYDNALNFYERSLKIREAMNNFRGAASSLNLIARLHSIRNNFEQALLYYNKSLELRKKIGDSGGLPWTYLGIASLHEKIKHFDIALEYYNKSIIANKETGDKRCDLQCIMGIGRILIQTSKVREGIEHLNKALIIAESLKAKPLLYEVHHDLSNAYEKINDSVNSLNHFKQFHQIKEEVYNAEITNRLKNQQISFAVERSEQKAEIHRLKNVELKAAYEQIEEKNKNIIDSINYASLIQKAILPEAGFLKQLFPDSFVFFKPKDIVSGDFFWLAATSEKIILVVADCTGHGVPGALLSMIGTDKLNQIIYEQKITKPSEILTLIHKGIQLSLKQDKTDAQSNDGMEMAICSFQLDKNKNNNEVQLEYAGSNRPLLIGRLNSDGNYSQEEIKQDKKSLGGRNVAHEIIFTNHFLSLKKGDCIFLFSDGFQDQFGGENDSRFFSKRLKELLLSLSKFSAIEQGKIIEETFNKWKRNTEQTDDVTVIGVKI